MSLTSLWDRIGSLPGRRYLGSRLGRRVLLLFVLSALIPLLLAGGLLAADFSRRIQDDARRELDRTAEGFGMVVIGRLASAAESLEAIAGDAALDPAAARAAISRFRWAHDATLFTQAHPDGEAGVPALKAHLQVVAPGLQSHGVWLERPLRGGRTLRVALDEAWLFASIDDYAGPGNLYVRDSEGRLLAASAGRESGNPRDEAGPDIERNWEMFLRAGLGAASWHVIAQRPLPTLSGSLLGNRIVFPGLLAASLAIVALFSAVAIRRQLRPLQELRLATERLSHRDFSTQIDTSARDEFGDLARTLASMSDSLRLQFSALEALAEVDRLLLHSPELEQILDTLLPRMAAILECGRISVLMLDPDLPQHGRAFEYARDQATQLPVRRVCELQAWQREGGPLRTVHALRRQEQVLGYLAVSEPRNAAHAPAALSAGDFADRLSLILANVEHSHQLHRQARFDALTGLPNRRTASEALALAVQAARAGGRPGALLYVDLDRFKRVNDTAGHRAGDELLCQVASRLQQSLRPGELAARLSGDEFLVVVPAHGDDAALAARATRLLQKLGEPARVAEREVQVEASIGIAVFPRDGTVVEDLLKCADIAMYRAKESGRARALFFEPSMQAQLQSRLALEAGLRQAVEREEFILAYQPIVPSEGHGPVGVEALLRWPAGVDGVAYPPSEFVPVAEDMGLIGPLGEWVLRTACREFMGWRRSGAPIDYLSVNASPLQLRQLGFPAVVKDILADSGMSPQQLVLEVTESVFADGAVVEAALLELTGAGVRLALDDFGTGYSSLSYLGKYPFHAVKIDRSFVMGLPGDANACRLVESILAMCAALGKRVIAEGVETLEQRAFLTVNGCQSLQGYLLGRPMGADAVLRAFPPVAAEPEPLAASA